MFIDSYMQATPFYKSCSAGQCEIVQLLLNDPRINVNCTIGDGVRTNLPEQCNNMT